MPGSTNGAGDPTGKRALQTSIQHGSLGKGGVDLRLEFLQMVLLVHGESEPLSSQGHLHVEAPDYHGRDGAIQFLYVVQHVHQFPLLHLFGVPTHPKLVQLVQGLVA